MTLTRRLSVRRLGHLYARRLAWLPRLVVAVVTSDLCGYETVVAYVTLGPRGLRRHYFH